MKQLFIYIFLLCSLAAFSQSATPTTINSGGGTATVGTNNWQYSIGETFTFTGGSGPIVTSGFNQPLSTCGVDIVYVDASAGGSNDGSSWENAYLKLEEAIDFSNSCNTVEQIWVAGGETYSHSSPFEITRAVDIIGGFPTGGGDGTITEQAYWDPANRIRLSTQNDNTYIFNITASETDTVRLFGLYLDGNANSKLGINVTGGNLYIESCVLKNLGDRVIEFETSNSIANYLSIVNSEISNFTLPAEGVEGVILFTDNNSQADKIRVIGSTIHTTQPRAISNSLFRFQGNGPKDLIIENSIVWLTENDGYEVRFESGGTVSLTNSIVSDFTDFGTTINSISTDPSFNDPTNSTDLSLQPGSPAGSIGLATTSISLPLRDLAGNLRQNPFAGAYESAGCADPLVVSLTTDDNPTGNGQCGDLRYAIWYANNNPGPHTITFLSVSEVTIDTLTLSVIREDVSIDGGGVTLSITDRFEADKPLFIITNSATNFRMSNVILDGSGGPTDNQMRGIDIEAANSRLETVTVTEFGQLGIKVDTSGVVLNDCLVENVGLVGVVFEGNSDLTSKITGSTVSNNRFGIAINDASATIGEVGAFNKNNISGNTDVGVLILGSGSKLVNNYIGVSDNGTSAASNLSHGIVIAESYMVGTFALTQKTSIANEVGDGTAAGLNIISGNGGHGILIQGDSASLNLINGNYIGTDITGNAGIGNAQAGISINNADSNRVENNVISGNGFQGVLISGNESARNELLGNKIGVNLDGTSALGNTASGVLISNGANNNRIGNGVPSGQNIIGGNGTRGVHIAGFGSSDNSVSRNFIGTNATNDNLGNIGAGVRISGGAASNRIGGITDYSQGNVISLNGSSGIIINENNTLNNVVAFNYIGVNQSGDDLGNNKAGVLVSEAAQNSINNNVIAYNDSIGIAYTNSASNNIHQNDSIYGNNVTGILIIGGAQNSVAPPVINGFDGTIVTGTNDLNASQVQVYADDSTQGRLLLGNATIAGTTWSYTISAASLFTINAMGLDSLTAIQTVTAAGNSNTSEFSAPRSFSVCDPLIVNKATDAFSGTGGECGTLRFAINELNALGGNDTITFDTVAMGGHTITLTSLLPELSDVHNAVIDGYDNVNKRPGIELAGFLQEGLVIDNQSSNITISGLVIGNKADGIQCYGDSVKIIRCYIGLAFDGVSSNENSSDGIYIFDCTDVQIGGEGDSLNYISGGNHGVYAVNTNTNIRVIGNVVGLNVTENVAIESIHGVRFSNMTSSSLIHGNTIVGGNTNNIFLDGSDNCIVSANIIGQNTTLTQNFPVSNNGVRFAGTAEKNQVGGLTADSSNIIAFHTGVGINVGTTTVETIILQNSIYSNGTSGINTSLTRVPQLTNITISANGTVSGTSDQGVGTLIQLYADSADQGQVYLDSCYVKSDGSWSKLIDDWSRPVGVDNLTATQTNFSKHITSRFSEPILIDFISTISSPAIVCAHSLSNYSVQVNWSPVVGASDYSLYHAIDSTGTLVEIGVTDTFYVFTQGTLIDNVVNYFAVAATGGDTSNFAAAIPVLEAGKALSLNGSNYVDAGSDVLFPQNGEAVSIEAWINFNNTGALNPIFQYGRFGSNVNILVMAIDATGKLVIQQRAQGAGADITSDVALSPGVNYHVAYAYGGGNLDQSELFINGESVPFTHSGVPVVSTITGGNVFIGFNDNGTIKRYFDGVIDEVRVWDRTLTSTEINNQKDKPLIGNESGLLGLWHFDEPTGNIAYDASCNGNNGTLINTPTVVPSKAMHPFAPQSLTAIAATNRDVTLSWSLNSALDVDSIEVHRGINRAADTLNGENWVVIKASENPFIDEFGASYCDTIYYFIGAKDSAGQLGVFSDTVKVLPLIPDNSLTYSDTIINGTDSLSTLEGGIVNWYQVGSPNVPMASDTNMFEVLSAGAYYFTRSDGSCITTSDTVIFTGCGDPLVVTKTTDVNECGTLRAAIIEANSNLGADTITFANALIGKTIFLTNVLPYITGEGTVINGFVDADDKQDITIDGRNISDLNQFIIGLNVDEIANDVEVKGLVIQHIPKGNSGGTEGYEYTGVGIQVYGNPMNVVIEKNILKSNDGQGIGVTNSTANVLLRDNILFNNGLGGVNEMNIAMTNASGVQIINNRIGVDSLSTPKNGISIYQSDNITVENNVIGDVTGGIIVLESFGNTIESNLIGVDENELNYTLDVGVSISGASTLNMVFDNVITNSKFQGIVVDEQSTLDNSFIRNSIYNNNEIGIQLNDGSNKGIQTPVISDLSNAFVVSGTIAAGTYASTDSIYIYADANNQGERFIKAIPATPTWLTTIDTAGLAAAGLNYLTVLLDSAGNTSEFSIPVELSLCQYTADAGKDTTLCSPTTLQLNGTVATPASQGGWTTTVDGTFSDTSSLTATYIFGTSDLEEDSILIILTPTTLGCNQVSDTMVVYFTQPPVIVLGFDTLRLCGDDTLVQYPVVAPTTISWTNTNGVVLSTTDTLDISFDDGPQWYFATITNTTCSAVDSFYFESAEGLEDGINNFGGNNIALGTVTLETDNQGSTSIEWFEIGDPINPLDFDHFFDPNFAGFYYFVRSSTISSCSVISDILEVTDSNNPCREHDTTFTIADTSICLGADIIITSNDNLPITWQRLDGSNWVNQVGVTNTFTLTTLTADTYEFRVILDTASCADTVVVPQKIEVKSPGTTTLNSDETVLPATLTTDDDATEYIWYRGFSPVSTTTTNTFFVTSSGNYRVRKDTAFCDVASEFVKLCADTTIQFARDSITICAASAENVELTGAFARVTWYVNGSEQILSDTAATTLPISTTSEVYATVRVLNGCEYMTDTVQVTAVDVSLISTTITGDTVIIDGVPVTLTATEELEVDSIVWNDFSTGFDLVTDISGNYFFIKYVKGCEVTSETVTVTTSTISTLTPGTIGSDQEICNGSTATINNVTAATSNTTFNYSWVLSIDGGIIWLPISSEMQESLVTSSLTETTQFRRVVSDGTVTDTSNAVTITVSATGGPTITGNVNLCASNSTVLSVLGGSTTENYQWYIDGKKALGETKQTINAYIEGIYTVTNSGGLCDGTSNELDVVYDVTAVEPSFIQEIGGSLRATPENANYTYQWYVSYESKVLAIVGATNSTYLPIYTGTYYVSINAGIAICTRISDGKNVTGSSGNNIANARLATTATSIYIPVESVSSSIQVIPNPALEDFEVIYTSGTTGSLFLSIIDMNGVEVMSESLYKNGFTATVHVSDLDNELNAGIYLIKIVDGDAVNYEKVMME